MKFLKEIFSAVSKAKPGRHGTAFCWNLGFLFMGWNLAQHGERLLAGCSILSSAMVTSALIVSQGLATKRKKNDEVRKPVAPDIADCG